MRQQNKKGGYKVEIKLAVYKRENGKRVLDKQYVKDTLYISFGIVEDILEKIDFNGDTTDRAIIKALPYIKPILKDIFDGITDDELKRCNTFDLLQVAKGIITYCVELIYGISDTGDDEKNEQREA